MQQPKQFFFLTVVINGETFVFFAGPEASPGLFITVSITLLGKYLLIE